MPAEHSSPPPTDMEPALEIEQTPTRDAPDEPAPTDSTVAPTQDEDDGCEPANTPESASTTPAPWVLLTVRIVLWILLIFFTGGLSVYTVLILAALVAELVPIGATLAIGLATVVFLGASGLILRGIGEVRGSKWLKATGYWLGALAYIATATVSLTGIVRFFAEK